MLTIQRCALKKTLFLFFVDAFDLGFSQKLKLKQFLFCPYGRIQLILENRNGREEIELSDPSIGVVIDTFTWREMLWLQKESVLCVAASDFYDADDYIRDYETFRKMMEE